MPQQGRRPALPGARPAPRRVPTPAPRGALPSLPYPVPRPPEGLGATGRALWRDTVANYTFTPTEQALLRELCRAHDTATRLTTHAKGVSVTVKGSRNQPVVNPIFAEIRATDETIARLTRALNLPDDRRNERKRVFKSRGRISAIQARQGCGACPR